MNEEAKQELERILSMDPASLNASEIGFLKARRSYLNPEQKAIFASVLEEKVIEVKAKAKK